MEDSSERVLREILTELKSIRQDLYNILKEIKTLNGIEYEVKEIKKKIR